MELNIGEWTVQIDFEKTKEYYQTEDLITKSCSCLYCRNYVEAIKSQPIEIINFFESLGIDPRKEGEVYQLVENEDGTHLYAGFYHVVGKIIKGEDCLKIEGINHGTAVLTQVIEGFNVGFTYDLSLVPSDFPAPVLQMEFEIYKVQWVINEKLE